MCLIPSRVGSRVDSGGVIATGFAPEATGTVVVGISVATGAGEAGPGASETVRAGAAVPLSTVDEVGDSPVTSGFVASGWGGSVGAATGSEESVVTGASLSVLVGCGFAGRAGGGIGRVVVGVGVGFGDDSGSDFVGAGVGDGVVSGWGFTGDGVGSDSIPQINASAEDVAKDSTSSTSKSAELFSPRMASSKL